MNQKRAIVYLDSEILKEYLEFPSNWEVVNCQWDFNKNKILLYVEGEDLQLIKEGEILPEGIATVTVTKDKNNKTTNRKIEWKIYRR